MIRAWLPQRAGSPSPVGGGDAAVGAEVIKLSSCSKVNNKVMITDILLVIHF